MEKFKNNKQHVAVLAQVLSQVCSSCSLRGSDPMRTAIEDLLPALQKEDASWKARYRLPTYCTASVATNAQMRGVVSSDFQGVMQVYAWDRASGSLEAKTDSPAGKGLGWIS